MVILWSSHQQRCNLALGRTTVRLNFVLAAEVRCPSRRRELSEGPHAARSCQWHVGDTGPWAIQSNMSGQTFLRGFRRPHMFTSIPTYTGELASTKCQIVPDVQLGSQVEASGKAPQPPGIIQERYIHPPYKVAQTPHARLVFSLPQVLRRHPSAVSHFLVDGVQQHSQQCRHLQRSSILPVQCADRTSFHRGGSWVICSCDNMSFDLHCGASSLSFSLGDFILNFYNSIAL